MTDFNRGSEGAGRKRDGARLAGTSVPGLPGTVYPRGNSRASAARFHALLQFVSKNSAGNEFNRGSARVGRRRNFALLGDGLAASGNIYSVQLYTTDDNISGSDDAVIWAGENYDVGDWWTSGTDITCPGSGTYEVAYDFSVASGSSGDPEAFTVYIKVNGVAVDTEVYPAATFTAQKSASVTLTTGDVVTITADALTADVIFTGTVTIS